MRYQVPQFIEIEDKIFGPLTLKQFIYLGGGAGLCLVFFTLFPLYITIILAIPVMSFSAGLAFYEFNGRPLIIALEHAVTYLVGTKLYLWKQRSVESVQPAAANQTTPTTNSQLVPKLSQSKLKDLAWSLNIKDPQGRPSADKEGFAL